MIYTILLLLHVIVSLLLVVVILLQSAKGGGLAGSAFGGGMGTSFLGARGTATFLSRATTILGIIFMLNSLGLSFLLRGAGTPVSVTQQEIASEAGNLPRVPDMSELGSGEIPIGTEGTSQDQGAEAPLTVPSEGGQSSGDEGTQQ